ncbi:hypothetical protein PIB30_038867 [Stylosanthes scabra]|uniref:Uncharacterized protein n=1 Tax=Stylosanthes scabra TaxID=79078 RepID=A0ABU6WE38_9FABA|nr:hypothetical protein [Stylosanthes scabra]
MRVTHCDQRNSVFLVEGGKPGHMWDTESTVLWLTLGHVTVASSRHFVTHVIMQLLLVHRVYEIEFLSIPDENLWPQWMGSNLRPNLHMKWKNKERLVSTRIRNEMDMFERPEKKCGIYRQYGHTRRGCSNAPASAD